MRYASALLLIAISMLISSSCVRNRSPEALQYTAESLGKQLEETDREYSRLMEERQRLEGDVLEAERLAKPASELLEERKRLEEELALARLELERSDDLKSAAGDLPRGETPGYPDIPAELPFTPSVEELHIVSKGECLSIIAGYKEYYDNQNLWPYIYIYNADQIGDPHWIFEGQQLLIPLE